MSIRLAIIGSRDLAQLIAYHARQAHDFQIVGFFDDFRESGNPTPLGPVLGSLDSIQRDYQEGRFDQLMVGIGYKHLQLREECHTRFREKIPFARVISSGCYVDPSASLGEGSFLLPGCTLDRGVQIGANSVLNTGVTIAHDSSVGTSSFLGPAVSLAGFVRVGNRCFLGIGTTVIDSVEIADGTQTGGGAVVTKTITEPGLYLGVPARLYRKG
ncbi:MAG: acetyltransferase [Vulcanimicrobiota bacterium]